MGAGRTVGVEEELFLVDPGTGEPAPRARAVLAVADRDADDRDREHLEEELYRHQVETFTDPTDSLTTLRGKLVDLRRAAAESAAEAGLAIMATGTVPTAHADPGMTRDDRYLDIRARYGAVAAPGGSCGMHVHVQVDSAEEGVAAVDAIAPWLPSILAISANSPFYEGEDTAYASWRWQVWGQFPSVGPTEPFGSPEVYRAVGDMMQRSGAARDEGMLYFDARLSKDQPTLEVRVADVCTDPDDAVLVAALARALVGRALEPGGRAGPDRLRGTGDAAGSPTSPANLVRRSELLRAAQWRAARYAMSDRLLHPESGELVEAAVVLEALVDLVGDQLDAAGDRDLVLEGLRRVRAGGGASRQRAAFERGGNATAVVEDLVERTNRSWRD